MNSKIEVVDLVPLKPQDKFIKKCIENRVPGKMCFLMSVGYMLITYLVLSSYPSVLLSMYCITFPVLFIKRIYSYIKSNDFLYLFDNCYFVNTALIIFLCVDSCLDTNFLPIFVTANGPVLWAVIPFRNSLAYHDIDKITSCFIHWAPPLICWSVRWFPHKTGLHWLRSFAISNIDTNPIYKWQPTGDWMWMVVIPLAFLVIHDIIYAVIVHGIIKPKEIYSDSFTYQRSKKNALGALIRRVPERWQLPLYMCMSLFLYVFGITIGIICYHVFMVHCILLVLQTSIIVWNGGCFYLDYYSSIAAKASKSDDERF